MNNQRHTGVKTVILSIVMLFCFSTTTAGLLILGRLTIDDFKVVGDYLVIADQVAIKHSEIILIELGFHADRNVIEITQRADAVGETLSSPLRLMVKKKDGLSGSKSAELLLLELLRLLETEK